MKSLMQGIIKRLHVDRRVMAQNKKSGKSAPALTIQSSSGPVKARYAVVHGPSVFIQRDERPLSCGARAWIETHSKVTYE